MIGTSVIKELKEFQLRNNIAIMTDAWYVGYWTYKQWTDKRKYFFEFHKIMHHSPSTNYSPVLLIYTPWKYQKT